MTPARRLTAAEAAVLDMHLPAGLTEEMRDVAWCLFEAMALMDSRAGAQQPGPVWLGVLHAMARVATAQLQHLAQQKGGKRRKPAPEPIPYGLAGRVIAPLLDATQR